MDAPPTRILILEDDLYDYELMKRELRRGLQEPAIDWVQDKAAFLLALEGPAPDAVLLDMSVPGFDGLRALEMARERLPDAPVIIVSGVIGEEVAIETLKAGATDYVLKQRLERLAPIIRRALHEAEQLRERREAEKALDTTRRRFEALFSSIEEGICLHEMVYADDASPVDCRILDVNPAFERIAGIPHERAVGMFASELFPQEMTSYFERFAEVARTSRPVSFEAYYPSLRRHLLVSAFSPEPGQFATLFVDITDRKDLERKLQERAAELARSNDELQQFAYVASHDLQEPLRMVTSYLTLLEKRCGDRLDDRAKEYLRSAVDGGAKATDLIQDLLQYSRAGSTGVTVKLTDMERLLARVCGNLRVQIEEEGAIVEHDPLPRILVDESQMLQVLQNLVSNAIKFHGPEPPTVHVSCEEQERDWQLCIRDNGIGIPPAQHERIFQIFQRGHTSSEYPGTGIGLAIAKKIVERHGGRIWVESEEGKGAVFRILLPKERSGGSPGNRGSPRG